MELNTGNGGEFSQVVVFSLSNKTKRKPPQNYPVMLEQEQTRPRCFAELERKFLFVPRKENRPEELERCGDVFASV
jgi:hypothetical protein